MSVLKRAQAAERGAEPPENRFAAAVRNASAAGRLPGNPRTLAVLLVLIASARIVSTYKILNHTIDEPAHLAAGIEWLEGGTYTYEDQHPPLARALGALGLHLAGARWSRSPEMYEEGYRLLGYRHRYWHNLFYSRAAMLPLFWIGSAVVFLWTRRIAGEGAAALATLVFTTMPPVLAHAGLATTDMAVTVFTGAAALSALCWADKPKPARSLALGFFAGLAVLSKFSALAFLPVCLLLMLRERLVRLLPRLALSLLVVALMILAAYRLSYMTFFNGIHAVIEHNKAGHPAYLLGSRSQFGFWYYYPVVAAVKTPLASLALAIVAVVAGVRLRIAAPLAFVAAIFLVAMCGHINIGIRHILPIYIGLAVCCGISAAWLLRTRAAVIAIALLAWQVVAGALVHPDYLAYTNEFAGSHPERILADSDLDWGQDMKRLADRVRQLGVKEFTFKINSAGYMAAGNDFPRFVQMPDGLRPRAGWNALSITPWKISGEPRWAETAVPRERIGRGVLLYYFPEQP